MGTKCVKWTSNDCLPCAGQIPAEVILCVNPDKLLDPTLHTLAAILTSVIPSCVDKCITSYTYTFCYDDSLLAVGATIFSADVSGVFCKTCLTTWIEDIVDGGGGGAVCVTDSDSIDFSIDDGGCVTGDVKLSEGGGEGGGENQITLEPDGLYVPPPSSQQIVDSNDISDPVVLVNGGTPILLVVCNAVINPIAVTIDQPSGPDIISFVKVDATANAVTIAATFGLISGAATYVLANQWDSVQLQNFGTNWYIIGKNP